MKSVVHDVFITTSIFLPTGMSCESSLRMKMWEELRFYNKKGKYT